MRASTSEIPSRSIAVRRSEMLQMVGVSAKTLARWEKEGMPVLRTSAGPYGRPLYLPGEVEDWLRRRQTRADQSLGRISERWRDVARQIVEKGSR